MSKLQSVRLGDEELRKIYEMIDVWKGCVPYEKEKSVSYVLRYCVNLVYHDYYDDNNAAFGAGDVGTSEPL